ncbi:zinc ribbon domain-containing protein [Methanobrevibacter sp.]|uniref:zinc ribbon domain-containing protein n=1 Tax=Methanobrevibacter sp. TaxID=66852 RepID=UPI00388DCDA2
MVIRRCPQCHTTSDDQYGFCIKCGYEFTKIEESGNVCPLCNYPNPDEADYCVKCGTPLIFKNQFENNESSLNPIVIKRKISADAERINDAPHTSRILIALGYIFSILGGLIGLIIAIYLTTRRDPVAKKHGRIQLGIFIFYLVLLLILILTGTITSDTLIQYSQMTGLGNLTNVTL